MGKNGVSNMVGNKNLSFNPLTQSENSDTNILFNLI